LTGDASSAQGVMMTFTEIVPVSGDAKGRLVVLYSVDQAAPATLGTKGPLQLLVRPVGAVAHEQAVGCRRALA
jgi:hypothetical protein